MSNAVDKATAQANLRRVVISSLMGAVIEWYDAVSSSKCNTQSLGIGVF